MSLQDRLSDLITAVGTDYKQLRTWATGSSTGDLTGLSTTDKTSLLAAINEVDGKAAPAPPAASETTAGVIEIATQAETDAGTLDNRTITPLKFQTRMAAFAQPLNTNLTNIASLAGQTTYGRAFLTLANQSGLMTLLRTATESVTGIAKFATSAEASAGSSTTTMMSPAKVAERLSAYAQPLSSNLSVLAGIVSGAFGRDLLQTSSASAARTALGLASIATSGSASDLTTGTLPTSVLPPLAITETFVVANQAAMLALTAQEGDVAVRTDENRTYILVDEPAGTLANWVQLTAGGDVLSVAGKTGVVTLNKGDVGLSNVDNTSDANKPVSSAQATADNLRLLKTANLSDLANVATARTNLSVYSQSQLGNPETDLVALYATAKS